MNLTRTLLPPLGAVILFGAVFALFTVLEEHSSFRLNPLKLDYVLVGLFTDCPAPRWRYVVKALSIVVVLGINVLLGFYLHVAITGDGP
jgi:uncharacterized membrane protein